MTPALKIILAVWALGALASLFFICSSQSDDEAEALLVAVLALSIISTTLILALS